MIHSCVTFSGKVVEIKNFMNFYLPIKLIVAIVFVTNFVNFVVHA